MLPRQTLKFIAERLPEPFGKALAGTPYSWRLGKEYARQRKQMQWFLQLDKSTQRYWVQNKALSIAHDCLAEHPFYRNFYRTSGIQSSISDFAELPIVTKEDFQQVCLEQRSILEKGRYLTNTGGSSGEPLVFFLDSKVFAREWAHMHFIWEQLDYRPVDTKLTFRGKNLGKRPILYNAVHNEYLVNAYCPYERIAEAVWRKLKKNKIGFLHGYPSAIYDFVRYCRDNHSNILEVLSESLKGILYGSEYPAAIYREPIEASLPVPSISWYGHSEFSVLAYEVDKYVYAPLHTYGYAEAVPCDDGYRLVCTGYYNRVSPFIRYDTGDIIEPLEQDGLLRSFRIKRGRVGDFIIDKDGRKISLTALIFGRHHPIFARARFLQIAQQCPGRATIVVTSPVGAGLRKEDVCSMMDLSDVRIHFDMMVVDEPIRTKAGKVRLKVPYQQAECKRMSAFGKAD